MTAAPAAQLARAGLLVQPAWILGALLAGATAPGYSFRAHAISGLAAAPGGWILNLSLVLSGAGAAVFGRWWAAQLPDFQGRGKVRGLLIGFGICFGLLGVFTAPGGLLTTGSTLHAAAFAGAMVCLIRAWELIADGLDHSASWEGFGLYCRRTRTAVLILIPLMLALFSPMSPLAALGLGGAAEWVLLLTISAWFFVSARRAGLLAGS